MTRRAVRAGIGIVAGMAVASLMSAAGLAEAPAFKTATLTTSMAAEGVRGGIRPEQDGKFGARKVTLRQLIDAAYSRHAFDRREITGGPEWIDSAYFDIAAEVGHEHVFDPDGFPRETIGMLRTLVTERFKLKIRIDSQPRPMYALTLAQPNTLGPQLRKSERDIPGEWKKIIAGGRSAQPIGVATYPGRMVANAVAMSSFATLLSGVVDRPVIDRTNLPGAYDFEVEGVQFTHPGPFGPSYKPSDTKESVFSTLPRQLGLKLEPIEGAVEVLVIEHAEMPAR
jgi:uncharacterized protein (TIGR03435 family)